MILPFLDRPSGRTEILPFALVGTVGFVVDASVLTGLILLLDWGLYYARALSFASAVTVTWCLNRCWTFTQRATTNRRREYSRYFVIQTMGALLNLGIYGVCIATIPWLGRYPLIPLAFGSSVAMVFNFAASRRFVFTGTSSPMIMRVNDGEK